MSDDKPDEKMVRQKERVASVRSAKGKGLAQEGVLGSGPANRHGMPRLPPGQHAVKEWPVLDLGIRPNVSRAEWRLEVVGENEAISTLDWEAFMGLEQVEDESDFHCVTTWSLFDSRWGGVRLSHLLEQIGGISEKTKYVVFGAYDGYTTNLPVEEAMKPDVLLVHTWQGIPLPREHGGPCRVITPQLYAWKGAKWVNKIELLCEDRPGFWETRGYSNTAHPWQDDRYSGDGPPPPTT